MYSLTKSLLSGNLWKAGELCFAAVTGPYRISTGPETFVMRNVLKRGQFCFIVGLLFLSLLCACERPSFEMDDLDAAREAAEQRDWAQVARLLQRYLREENDPEQRWTAWNLQVTASEHMGERLWAIEYLEAMLQEYGNNPVYAGAVLRQLGDSYEMTRQWDKASRAWLQLLDITELAPDEAAFIYRRMGIFHQQARNFALAEDMFEMCIAQASTPSLLCECRFYLADTFATDGHLDEALQQITELLAASGASDEIRGRAFFLQGDLYEQQEKREEAAQAFADALSLHPNPSAVQARIDYLANKPEPLLPQDNK